MYYYLLRHRQRNNKDNNKQKQQLDGTSNREHQRLLTQDVTLGPVASLRLSPRNDVLPGSTVVLVLLVVVLFATCLLDTTTTLDWVHGSILLQSICDTHNHTTIQPSNNTLQGNKDSAPQRRPSETTRWPSSQPSSSPPFSGSTLSKLSEGMDVMEHVCVFPAKRFIDIHSYTVDGKSLRSNVQDFFDAKHNRSSLMYASSTIGNTLDQWTVDVSRGQWIQEETLLALAVYNPGHCLQDEIFPIALDRYVRKSTSPHPTKETTNNRPFYKRLLYLPIGKPAQVIDEPKERDWCLSILNHSGLVDANQAYYETSSPPRYPLCFRRLLVPRLGVFRFPFDYSDRETMNVYRNHPTQSQFLLRDIDRPPFTDSYPTEAFEELRRQTLQGLALPYHPWDPREMYDQGSRDQNNDKLPHDLRVLIYDRRGLGFRSWVNSVEVRHQLEAQYHVTVTHVNASDWERMKLPEQAALINAYPRLLMPHGGHEGNLIFCRPRASVIEIECLEDPVASILDETEPFGGGNTNSTTTHPLWDDDAMVRRNKLPYYGPPNFYTTYTRRIGIAHFVMGEVHGCRHSAAAKHYSPELVVNVSRLVNFVANRWSLVPRTA